MEVRDRNLLEVLLKSEFDRAKRHDLPLSCIMLCICDLTENIKKRGAGFLDTILEESVTLLSGMVRTSDIIALYTKKTFLIVLPMVNTDSTAFVAQRIHRTFAQYKFSDQAIPEKITVIMGNASITDKEMSSPEDLIRCAETALERARSQGGDTLCLWRDLIEQS